MMASSGTLSAALRALVLAVDVGTVEVVAVAVMALAAATAAAAADTATTAASNSMFCCRYCCCCPPLLPAVPEVLGLKVRQHVVKVVGRAELFLSGQHPCRALALVRKKDSCIRRAGGLIKQNIKCWIDSTR
jgi:hypothetical protein